MSFVFEFELRLKSEHLNSVSLTKFFLTNIYLLQACMISYKNIIRTHKQKWNTNKKFLLVAIWLPGYLMAIH